MKTSLFILPFLALVFAALAVTTGLSLTELPWVSYVFWGLALTSGLAWVIADFEGFKRVFSNKGAGRGASSGITVVLGILVLAGIGFLSQRQRFNKSVDVTRDQVNTLSDQSVKAISTLQEAGTEITAQTFFQDEQSKLKFESTLALYQAEGLQINVEHIDPQLNPTAALAANVTTADTVILKAGEGEARLSSFTEEKTTNALLNLLKTERKTILFTAGHGERDLSGGDASGYQLAKTELEAERYDVGTVNLLEEKELNQSAEVLVIAGPQYDFREQEIVKIKSYLKNGTSLMILLDAMQDLPNLKKLSAELGLAFEDNILLLRPDDPRAQILGQNNAIITEFDRFSPLTKDYASQGQVAMVVPNVRSIKTSEKNSYELAVTDVAKASEIVIGVTNVATASDLENIEADRIVGGPFTMIATASGQIGGEALAQNNAGDTALDAGTEAASTSKEVRVVAVGTAELASNAGAQRAENLDMFLNSINYLAQDDSFISIRPKDLTASTLDLSSMWSQLSLQFISFVYPMIFLGLGVVYWLRRRRA